MKPILKILAASKKLRFVLVGAANTLIDFGLFTLMVSAGLNPIIANYFSTAMALIFSYFANKNYTFNKKDPSKPKEVMLFIIVTLVGIWVLQPLTIGLLHAPLEHLMHNSISAALVCKLLATVISLTWNYVTYNRFVFQQARPG